MKSLYIALGVIAALAWLGIGFIIAQGPQPEIVVAAEVITKVGPLNISKTLITTWVVMVILIVMSLVATRSMKLLPSGFQNFVEASIEFLLDQIESIAGVERGRRFLMLVATIFLFVIVSNWLGLLPFFNAIGKVEDVGHEVFHEIELHHEEGHAFEEEEKFVGVKMGESGGITFAMPRSTTEEFEIEAGEEPPAALDRYIVFLAEIYTDFEAPEGEGSEEHPRSGTVEAAAAALEADPSAPQLLFEEHSGEEGEGEHGHGVESPALHEVVSGVEFSDEKFALVIPYFRSVNSDLNNTLALAIVAFLAIEFWGFQALGIGYLTKFFNLQGIGTFVGLLEFLSELIRIISFAFRLFGNIFAGEVLILILTFLMPFLFVDIIYGLELFVGFIQAAVFALLTLVFAVMATEHHGEGGDHSGSHDDSHQPEGATQVH